MVLPFKYIVAISLVSFDTTIEQHQYYKYEPYTTSHVITNTDDSFNANLLKLILEQDTKKQ